jgi:hypothetical protein
MMPPSADAVTAIARDQPIQYPKEAIAPSGAKYRFQPSIA